MSQDLENVTVIVVDSAPLSEATRSISQTYQAGYVLSPLKGLSRARNIGTRALATDVVAYLDDDMVPSDGWPSSILKAFSDDQVMGATGPILPLEMADASLSALRYAVAASSWGPSLNSVDRTCADWFERTNFGGIGDGNFALRREGFDEIGGFDDRLGRGAHVSSGEEHYAYFRLALANHRIAYVPEAIVFHPPPKNDIEDKRRYIQEASAYLSFLVWNHPQYSFRIIKYIIEGALGKSRLWRRGNIDLRPKIGIRDYVSSGVIGLSIFLRSVWPKGRRNSQP
jgi:glycosyltransferase involved in cell wall biosynthesis